jgi:hypothetical protein
VLHVILHLHDEAVGELGIDGARVDEGRAGRDVLELRHLLVERDGVGGRICLVERETHGDAHPEELRNLERVAVAALDAVAVVERDESDVLEQLVVVRLERLRQDVEVEEFGQPRVEESLVDSAGDVRREVGRVKLLELRLGLVVAEHALVDGLQQKAGCHDVERRVIFDVLQRHLDDCLIQLLGGDPIEQRQLELRGDLGYPGDVLVEAGTRVLDREVDLVCVIWLTLAIALDDGYSHEKTPYYAPRIRAANQPHPTLVKRRTAPIYCHCHRPRPGGLTTIYRGTCTRSTTRYSGRVVHSCA